MKVVTFGAVILTAMLVASGSAAAQTVVHHVSSADLARAPRYRLGPDIVTSIGGASEVGGIEVGPSSFAAIRDDGRLLVFSPFDGLDVFDRFGKRLHHGGRTGQGPGEFRSGRLFAAGDTLVIFDQGNARLSWWNWDAQLLRTQSVAERLSVSTIWHVVASFPDGHLILSNAGMWSQPPDGKPPARSVAAIVDLPSQGLAKALFSVPDVALASHPLKTPNGSWLVTDHVRFGSKACVAQWGNRLVTGVGDQYRVDVRNSRGNVTASITLDKRRRPFTRLMREQSIAREVADLAQARDIPDRPNKINFVRAAPYPDSLPAYDACLTSSAGVLWLVDGHTPLDSVWTATGIQSDGTVAGILTAPTTDYPLQFGRETVLLRHIDADGVWSYVVRRMVRQP